jgi:hypothetical protein
MAQAPARSHSSGPWHVEHPYGEPGAYIASADTGLVAKAWGSPQEEANARLLAAAPCLLSALHNLCYSARPIAEMIDAGRAAIAKATAQI